MKSNSSDLANFIQDRAYKMEKIEWQKCKWLQPESLKTLMEIDFVKLVKSFQENDSIDPLKVWEEKPGIIWILDGHHRQKVLGHCLQNEKKKPPRLMNAIFIDCKDKKEAAKFCLLYATEYAKIEDQGLYEFLHTFDLQFDDIKTEIELPGINLDSFQACYYSDFKPTEPKEKEVDELQVKNECPKCGYTW